MLFASVTGYLVLSVLIVLGSMAAVAIGGCFLAAIIQPQPRSAGQRKNSLDDREEA